MRPSVRTCLQVGLRLIAWPFLVVDYVTALLVPASLVAALVWLATSPITAPTGWDPAPFIACGTAAAAWFGWRRLRPWRRAFLRRPGPAVSPNGKAVDRRWLGRAILHYPVAIVGATLSLCLPDSFALARLLALAGLGVWLTVSLGWPRIWTQGGGGGGGGGDDAGPSQPDGGPGSQVSRRHRRRLLLTHRNRDLCPHRRNRQRTR